MSTPFHTLHHVCVVVADIDRAVEFYLSAGIGPWHDYPPLTQYTFNVPDREPYLDLKYKFADVGTMQLQLLEPGAGDTPMKRFLEDQGGGVFHLGFVVDDVDAGTEAARALGIPPWIAGRRPDSSGFTYFDTTKQAGVNLEIRQSPKKG
ncbi:VOC family protein [Amycolatopsis sp. lyj-112]|uniref:VOC family protein n=1 Tax=Amycolatopsis sp. lyj-112 TaxID=2789288 RepID=UPI00397DD749